ncbi:MAG TPA: hypothetical protein VFC93_07895, partial [Chloroflexota bacterium]|nr:hypothetical protein [Chloroflexota bacterium]
MRRALPILLVLLLLIPPAATAAADEEDFAIPNGRFFPQSGFAITDQGGIPFWTEFQRLGGVRQLGYPISTRYQVDGFVMQAAQRGIMQWRPEQGHAVLTNVLDDLSKAGRDPW